MNQTAASPAYLHQPAKEPPASDGIHSSVEHMIREHEGESGFCLLPTGSDAFACRLALIQASRQTLDMQYYIVQSDVTGRLLMEEIFRAADRGVQVRLLLDDLDFHRGSDPIRVLDSHSNIEIRVFNPAITRRQRWMHKIFRFSRFFERYSKRMHNKLLIADGVMAVAGGRNLGDEYFDARAAFAFNDLDVMTIGPVSKDMDACFERYWSARASHTLRQLGVKSCDARTVALSRITLRRFYDDVAHRRVISRKRPSDILEGLRRGDLPLVWSEAEFLSDDPDKVYTPVEEADSPPMRRLQELLENAGREFLAVSPYFIPATLGMQLLEGLLRRGLNISILTNSLGSTDISAVHAAYCRYRLRMLQKGIKLYELKALPGKGNRHNLLRRGSSRSSLHAKAYIIDCEWVMLGSMNLDPRSWRRNTETMIAVRSPALAGQIAEMFHDITHPSTSLHLKLQEGKDDAIEWHTEEDGKPVRHHREPYPGWFRRIATRIFYHLAPEGQL